MCLFQFWFPQGIYLVLGFLGHMVVLFLVFKGISILVAYPVHDGLYLLITYPYLAPPSLALPNGNH